MSSLFYYLGLVWAWSKTTILSSKDRVLRVTVFELSRTTRSLTLTLSLLPRYRRLSHRKLHILRAQEQCASYLPEDAPRNNFRVIQLSSNLMY
jgi:hypothetical protein